MKILSRASLRVVLGAAIAAYGLASLPPVGAAAFLKLGLVAPAGEATRLAPLWAATSWLQMAANVAVAVLFVLVGWRLIRARAALGLYLLAVLLDAALWWVAQSSDAYQLAFTAGEMQLDYDIVVGLLAAGVLTWWLERRPASQTSAV